MRTAKKPLDDTLKAKIAEGLSDRAIGELLGISRLTVGRHRRALGLPRYQSTLRVEPDRETTVLVIGALRQLASAKGLDANDLAERLAINSEETCRQLLTLLVTLGVARTVSEGSPRYVLRKDWL